MRHAEALLLHANRVLVAAALAAIFLIVFLNVVLRYGFGTSLAWAEEMARFLMILGTFAGAGLALLVAIDMLQELLPRGLRLALRWSILLVMGVFMALLLYYGWRFVAFGWNKETMATQISRGIPYLAIPVGAALFLLHLLFFARRYVAQDFELAGEPEEGPPAGPPER